MRVVAFAPGLASCEINLVAAQEPPDILDVNIVKFPGQQGPGPAREPGRRRFIEQLQNPFVGRLRIDRLLARPRFACSPSRPRSAKRCRQRLTIRGWTPTSLAIERVLRPAAANRTIRARFKSRCNVTGERQHASSTLRSFLERWTSLASGIIPMLNHDSRSRESGY